MDFDDSPGLIYGVLVFLGLFSIWLFQDIIWTLFFAASLAYVLNPVNKNLKSRGFGETISAVISTLLALIAILTVALPFLVVLYRRRDILISFLEDLPQTLSFEILNYSFNLQVETLIDIIQESVVNTALGLAQSAPVLLLKLLLAIVVLYSLIKNAGRIRDFAQNLLTEEQETILMRYHIRAQKTLKGLYVVQASTAALTFLLALPVFYLLGYEPFISLSLLAGILQLIPILGPSILIIILAGAEFILGNVFMALIVLVSGLLVIALIPDILLRMKIADRTTALPASLYFLGFIGGLIALGAIGVIVGPLAVALLAETLEIMSEE